MSYENTSNEPTISELIVEFEKTNAVIAEFESIAEEYARTAERIEELTQTIQSCIERAAALKSLAEQTDEDVPEDQMSALRTQFNNSNSGLASLLRRMKNLLLKGNIETLMDKMHDMEETRADLRNLLITRGVPAAEID